MKCPAVCVHFWEAVLLVCWFVCSFIDAVRNAPVVPPSYGEDEL